LHPREGQLHAADVRQHFQPVLAEPVAQVTAEAVEQRIATDEDHHALAAEVCFQRPHRLLQVGADDQPLGSESRREGVYLFGADHYPGGTEQFTGPVRKPAEPVTANADDVDSGFRRCHDGSSHATTATAELYTREATKGSFSAGSSSGM